MKILDYLQSKIYTRESIVRQCSVWRFMKQPIIFTNGCFDILHLGHIEYLSKAKDLGGKLIIGLNSDASTSKLKGPGRPFQDERSRAFTLASLTFVDGVILFDEDTPYELIQLVRPDILVKGQDYKPEEIAGNDIVSSYGGRIVTIELTPGYSTTGVERKILSSNQH